MIAVLLATVIAFPGMFHFAFPPHAHPADFRVHGSLPDGTLTMMPVYEPGQMDGPHAHRPSMHAVILRKEDGACIALIPNKLGGFIALDKFIAPAGITREEVVLPWQFDTNDADVSQFYTVVFVCGDASDQGRHPHWSPVYRVSVGKMS